MVQKSLKKKIQEKLNENLETFEQLTHDKFENFDSHEFLADEDNRGDIWYLAHVRAEILALRWVLAVLDGEK